MTIRHAVALAFSNYATFRGRASRQAYWYFFLFRSLMFLGLALVFALTESKVIGLLLGIFYLGVWLPTLSSTTRRLHDTDRSGWFIYLNAVPVLGAICLLFLLSEPGSPEGNRFGPQARVFEPPSMETPPTSNAAPWIASAIGLAMLAGIAVIVVNQVQAAQADSQRQSEMTRASAESSAKAEAQRARDNAARDAATKAAVEAANSKAAAAAAASARVATDKYNAAQAQAAAAQVAATAEQADMKAKGWAWYKDQLYYSWVTSQDLTCPTYSRCTQVKVVSMAPKGCAGGITVDLSLDVKGLSTGNATGYSSSGLPAGKGALVTVTFDTAAKIDAISMLSERCF